MDIRRTCYTCDGDGLVEHGESGTRICYSCHGTGISDEGAITDGSKTLAERLAELEVKIDDVMNKCEDIFNKVEELE